MIVDEEFRHSLGDRRFELPDNHPAHRRMRELLMSEVEIAEFESQTYPTSCSEAVLEVHRQVARLTNRKAPPFGKVEAKELVQVRCHGWMENDHRTDISR